MMIGFNFVISEFIVVVCHGEKRIMNGGRDQKLTHLLFTVLLY